jgi:hypothetical protein
VCVCMVLRGRVCVCVWVCACVRVSVFICVHLLLHTLARIFPPFPSPYHPFSIDLDWRPSSLQSLFEFHSLLFSSLYLSFVVTLSSLLFSSLALLCPTSSILLPCSLISHYSFSPPYLSLPLSCLYMQVMTISALEQGKNVLVDGSLRDASWYLSYIRYMPIYVYMYIRTHTFTHKYAYMRMDIYIYVCTNIHTHAHTHAHAQKHSCVFIHTCIYMY